MSPTIDRRAWLKTAGAAVLGAGLGSRCAAPVTETPKLSRVRVSPDRVIRTTVGLRPSRPSGFVLKSERLGDKTVIHNYGHGGSGMSLSWGTAHLAVDEALKTGETRYAVIGAGVVGLSTARLLQRRGFEVTMYAKDLPPRTTSNMSGAWFGPTSASEPGHITPEYTETWLKATRLSHRYFQDHLGDEYGVHWLPHYAFSENPPDPEAPRGLEGLILDLFPESRQLEPGQHPFPSPYVRRRWTMRFEPAVYLGALMRDYRLAGGRVVVREFESLDQLLGLSEPVLVNCTGLGAKVLFDDEELHPINGQLTVLLPQPDINYLMVSGELYMMPRRDGIVLGGTHEEDEWSLEPSDSAMRRLMDGHMEFFGAMT